MKKYNIIYIVSFLFLSWVFTSCIDDEISNNPQYKLSFSADTVLFDTVFTTVGSSTQILKIYNKNSKNINISSLKLAGGENSFYHLNVDGEVKKSNIFNDIELRANDSLYVFVEVNIDPQNSNSPIFVKDSIVFNTNSNIQNVKLLSYGQDVEILHKTIFKNDTLLSNPKPFLVMDTLFVDSNKTLTLAEGTKMYFHNKTGLFVYGNLVANGTLEKPILLRGDRTDKIFENTPYNMVSNQWEGVFLLNPKGNHRLNYVTINSGYIGLFFINENRNFCPKMSLKNSRIHNFLKYGLCVRNGDVEVVNSEITNTGSYSVFLNGGKHSFIHCTIANYFNSTRIRIQPSDREQNSALVITDLNRVLPTETTFKNCIITGAKNNEFSLLSRFEKQFNADFSNCYIKKENPDSTLSYYKNVVWANYNDTVFRNTVFGVDKKYYYNFSLDSVSPAREIGNIDVAKLYPLDINGKDRLKDGKPDAGASEWFSNYSK